MIRESLSWLALPKASTYGQANQDYSLRTSITKTRDLRFLNRSQATRIYSLAGAAAGLRAKWRLSFETVLVFVH